MGMNVEIRRARSDEADVLTDLAMRSKQSNGYDDAFMAACRDELTVTTESLRKAEHWVADNGTVCGCACLATDGDGLTRRSPFILHRPGLAAKRHRQIAMEKSVGSRQGQEAVRTSA